LFDVAADMLSASPRALNPAAAKIYLESRKLRWDMLTCGEYIACGTHGGALNVYH